MHENNKRMWKYHHIAHCVRKTVQFTYSAVRCRIDGTIKRTIETCQGHFCHFNFFETRGGLRQGVARDPICVIACVRGVSVSGPSPHTHLNIIMDTIQYGYRQKYLQYYRTKLRSLITDDIISIFIEQKWQVLWNQVARQELHSEFNQNQSQKRKNLLLKTM